MAPHAAGTVRTDGELSVRANSGDATNANGHDRYQLRAVGRALDLLVAMSDPPEPIDLTALARRVGLHPATALRHLESLRARGFVRQQASGSYVLGARVFELGNAFVRRLTIWTHANELAEALATQTAETASVGVLDEGTILYIAIAHGQNELGIQSSPGARHPVHCTALGKAILAALPPRKAQAILQQRTLKRLTARTFVETAELQAELRKTAARGFAIDNEERLQGVFCIGAPIFDYSGSVVGAISISGPKVRMKPANVRPLADKVMAAAAEGSRRLGAPATLLRQQRTTTR
jgi:DNA-binding IclR family transcriptional regulator